MTLAAHIILSKKTDQHYLLDTIIVLAKKLPEDHFIIFTDEPESVGQLPAANITPVQVKPAIKNNLSFYYWYNFKLPALLKRYGATAFISESGAISLRAQAPQFLFLKEGFFAQHEKHLHKRYLLKYFPRFAEKSAAIFTTEKCIAAGMQKKFPQAAEKNFTLYHGLSAAYLPFSWEEKETVTNAFTSGNDYFIYYVSENTKANIKIGLKAFSIFKKWQKSKMKLVLLLDQLPEAGLVPDMSSYKYREEVLMIASDATTAPPLIAAAMAVLYLPKHITGENIGLNALQCHVPLITPGGENTAMTFAGAAAYVELNETSVAEKMLLLYKDEAVRKTLIENGIRLLQHYDLERSAAEMLNVIRLKSAP